MAAPSQRYHMVTSTSIFHKLLLSPSLTVLGSFRNLLNQSRVHFDFLSDPTPGITVPFDPDELVAVAAGLMPAPCDSCGCASHLLFLLLSEPGGGKEKAGDVTTEKCNRTI